MLRPAIACAVGRKKIRLTSQVMTQEDEKGRQTHKVTPAPMPKDQVCHCSPYLIILSFNRFFNSQMPEFIFTEVLLRLSTGFCPGKDLRGRGTRRIQR